MTRAADRRARRKANRARRRRARLWPIRFLLDHFFGALERIAPEKSAALQAEMKLLGVSFIVEGTDKPFCFTADPPTKMIRVGLGALGRLWATGYGYYCLYTKVAAAKRANLAIREIEFNRERRTAIASKLLAWAVHAELILAEAAKAKKPLPPLLWPTGLPKPRRVTRFASDQHVADELFLCAGAFILHHELGHFRCKHVKSRFSEDNRDMETEADQTAAKWILDGLAPSDARFRKRAMGVALALGWAASIALYVPEDQVDHPPSWQRLATILEQFVVDDNDVIWAFVSTLLRANLESAKMRYDKLRPASSFKDDVQYCLSLFKQHKPAKLILTKRGWEIEARRA